MNTHHLNVKVPIVATMSNIEIGFVEKRELALVRESSKLSRKRDLKRATTLRYSESF